ncbi:S8 family peptidase [Nitriliruptor alkaliphilus]|uniref:S8 family peptidase n=1 Tax=Nitriliruptor alkaliphilus TaxID=427918 RepID=UPI000696CC0D|nr:S8 family serine peptidase [Nitriliruptor alkaliphilus]
MRWTALAVVGAVVLGGCTSSNPFDVIGPITGPTGLVLESDGESHVLRFEAVTSASAYLLEVDETTHPVPVEACDPEGCALGVEGLLSNAADRKLRVVAMAEDGRTATSPDAVVLPVRSQPEVGEPEDSGAIYVVRRDGDGTIEVESRPVADAEAGRRLLAELARDPAVEAAGWDVPVAPLRGPLAQAATGLVDQGPWHLGVLGLAQPDLPLGDGSGVTVAVIDSGVDAQHPGLRGQVLPGTSIAVPGADGTTHPGFHGTGVASLIVGTSPAYGAGPGAKVLPVDAVGPEGGNTYRRMIAGIVYAVDAGADIINISAGASCGGGVVAECADGIDWAVRYAEDNGVLVVAAAGNNGPGPGCDTPTNEQLWPAALALVVTVGASDLSGSPWKCTNGVRGTDVLAPGVGVPVYRPTGDGPLTGTANGTSGSAPIVAGIAARLLSTYPDLSPAALRVALTRGGHWSRSVISISDVIDEAEAMSQAARPDPALRPGRHLWELDVHGEGVWDLEPDPGLTPGHDHQNRVVFMGYIDIDADGSVTGRGHFGTYRGAANHLGQDRPLYEEHACDGDVMNINEIDVTGSVGRDGSLSATLDFEVVRYEGRADCPDSLDPAMDARVQANSDEITARIDAVLDRLTVVYDPTWPLAPIVEDASGLHYSFEVLPRDDWPFDW